MSKRLKFPKRDPETQYPILEEIVTGWAAYGDGWGIHAPTKDEALTKYNERAEFYARLLMGGSQYENLKYIEFVAPKISEIPCAACGGQVVEYSITSRIWNKIIRPDGHEIDHEYYCVWCFLDKTLIYIDQLSTP